VAKEKLGFKFSNRTPAMKRLVGETLIFAFVSFTVVFGATVGYKMVALKSDVLYAAADTARDLNLDIVVAAAEDIYYGYITSPTDSNLVDPVFAADETATPEPSPTEKTDMKANVERWGAAQQASQIPDPLRSIFSRLRPGEGQWHATKIKVAGMPAIYTARVRTEKSLPDTYATVAWFDTKLLAFEQYAGTELPEGNYKRGTGAVPKAMKPFYVASMAGAYLLKHSQGGYIYNGQLVKRMVRGKATLFTYPDGSVDIQKYGSAKVREGYVTARQNLAPDVYNGRSQVNNETESTWGWVWEGVGSGKNLVYRTGIGIRKDGTIVYVIGKALSAKSLAQLLANAGADRAMALDMNTGYAHAFLYGPYLKRGGVPINPDRQGAQTLFYKASDRDYIAVFAKSPAN